MTVRRWLFGDQLGPHFLDDERQPVLLVESKAVFRRRAFHRQKAHLMLSAIRHRARELDGQAVLCQTETYSDALREISGPLSVCHPTSRAAADFVTALPNVTVLPPRGFVTEWSDFEAWATGQDNRLRMDSFYRYARTRHNVLMDAGRPRGGRWSYDVDNRHPPPRTGGRLDVAPPPAIVEDDIDAEVRRDLDRWSREGIRFVGKDGPRLFPATRAEALSRLRQFITHRLADFGRYEDAMLAEDPMLAHSLLSPAFNLGLLHPMEAIRRAEARLRAGKAPLSSVEGFCRQLLGWRDYIWHLYWHLPASYARRNSLGARRRLPGWFAGLDADAVRAHCLSDTLAGVRDRGWVHHIPRLMILGNYALQRGWHPARLADWFHQCFVDGYEWVMVGNVIGMSQYADLGLMTTKPYAAGGAYIDRMSDYCRDCSYNPKIRLGQDACPYTAGYWAFLSRNRELLQGNPRLAHAVGQLDRLDDIPDVVEQEANRAARPA